MIAYCCMFADRPILNDRSVVVRAEKIDGIIVMLCKYCGMVPDEARRDVIERVKSGRYVYPPRSLWEEAPF